MASGLTFRTLAETAADTLDWHLARPAKQQAELRDWHQAGSGEGGFGCLAQESGLDYELRAGCSGWCIWFGGDCYR